MYSNPDISAASRLPPRFNDHADPLSADHLNDIAAYVQTFVDSVKPYSQDHHQGQVSVTQNGDGEVRIKVLYGHDKVACLNAALIFDAFSAVNLCNPSPLINGDVESIKTFADDFVQNFRKGSWPVAENAVFGQDERGHYSLFIDTHKSAKEVKQAVRDVVCTPRPEARDFMPGSFTALALDMPSLSSWPGPDKTFP